MSLTKQDLDHIQKIVNESEVRLEKKIEQVEVRLDDKIEGTSKAQTEHLLDAMEGIAETMYGNFPTREEVKKGLKAFSESVILKTS